MKRLITLFVALLSVMSVAPAHAAIIYNTFNSSDQYSTFSGWNLKYDDSFGMGFDIGTTDMTLDTIEFAAGYSQALDINLILDVDIMSSDASNKPDTVLESFQFTSLPKFGNGQVPGYPILSATSSSNPVLSANSRYWLVISPQQTSGIGGAWNFSSPGVVGWRAFRSSPTATWSTSMTNVFAPQGAFRITGDPGSSSVIPEPTTMLLFGTGLIGLTGFRRRIKTEK